MSGLFEGTTLPEPEFEFSIAGGDGSGWLPIHMHLAEGLSQVYEASILLAHALPAPPARGLLEQAVGVGVSRGAGGRSVRGLVRRVESLGTTGFYAFVRVVVVPQLWTLSLRQNSRIWQDLPVAAVVREVLRDAALYQDDDTLVIAAGLLDLPPREYCVQYRESDLAFVQRLLAAEGIAFYFRHEGEREALVLVERDHGWAPVPTMDQGALRVLDAGIGTASVESVQWLDAHRQLRPTGVVLRDYDFTRPDATLDLTKSWPGNGGSRAVYDYPAGFTLRPYDEGSHTYGGHHGAAWARVAGEALQADVDVSDGRTNVTGMAPGMTFRVAGHVDGALDGRQLVVSVEHHAIAWEDIPDDLRGSEHFRAVLQSVGADFARDASGVVPSQARYWNHVRCVPAAVPWRPPQTAPRPVIAGPQTALVMAEPGSSEEVCVDFHGRVLVRFHWERPEQRPASQRSKRSSCWVRVAQSWAGASWGAMFIPRVGMEVVVQFLEGDPDRPLVMGCVYNGKNHPPYELPQHKTRSALKTLSSPGGDGYNELRFEDLRGEEQVWMHAQRDHDVVVRNDATLTVGHDRTQTVHHDEQLTVFHNRATAVHRNDSLEVEGDRSVMVHGGGGLAAHVDARYRLNAEGGVLITCGGSTIEMTPEQITIASKTVNVVGKSLVNINGALVKLNCDPPKSPAKGDALAATAVRALELMGQPGSLLDKLRGLVNPAQLAEVFTRGLDGALAKIGVPARIRERLNGVARGVAAELVTAARSGRAPDVGRLRTQTVGAVVSAAVGEVFRPLERAAAGRGGRALAGLVREARDVSADAATFGVLHAAGVSEAMGRDPFWQTMRERHAPAWQELMASTAVDAGRRAVAGYLGRHGATAARGGAGAGAAMLTGATERGVRAGGGGAW